MACRQLWAGDMGACVTSETDVVETVRGDDWSLNAKLTGTVTAIDPKGASCEGYGDGEGFARLKKDNERSYAFTVQDGERSVKVSLLLPWSTPIVSVGDTISLEYVFMPSTWSPTRGALTLRDAQGAVLLWIAQASAGPSQLEPPDGIRISDGAAKCSWEEGCGIRARKSTRVQAGDHTVEIPYGGSHDVGDYAFAIGENSQFEMEQGSCTDISNSHTVLVAALRGKRSALIARDRGPCGASSCAEHEYCAIPKAGGCNAASAGATCTAAPKHCGIECPLVCGCDGKPYCNACRAQQAGVAIHEGDRSCVAAGGDTQHPMATTGPCSVHWSRFGKEYGFRCEPVGDVQRCTCRYGQELVGSVDTEDEQCKDVPGLCGFPPFR